MAPNNPIRTFPAIFTVLITSMLALASTAPPPAVAGGCSDEVVAFSPCLDYISSPPNNISFSPSAQCCGVFSSAFGTGLADCLCYLVQRPLLLGFPLNSTRLVSLSSLCPLKNSGSNQNSSLESLCSGLLALPPLRSTAGPDNSPPPLMSLPPESTANSPTTPSSTLIPAKHSSAAKQIKSIPLGMMIYLVAFFSYI